MILIFNPLKLSDDIKVDKFLFLDTNIFIHCKDFSKISWKRLFNDKTQKIILIIPETVLDELDELKNQIGKIKKAISNIRKYRGTNFQKGVELRLS